MFPIFRSKYFSCKRKIIYNCISLFIELLHQVTNLLADVPERNPNLQNNNNNNQEEIVTIYDWQ